MLTEAQRRRRIKNHLNEHPPLASALLKQAAPGARAPGGLLHFGVGSLAANVGLATATRSP